MHGNVRKGVEVTTLLDKTPFPPDKASATADDAVGLGNRKLAVDLYTILPTGGQKGEIKTAPTGSADVIVINSFPGKVGLPRGGQRFRRLNAVVSTGDHRKIARSALTPQWYYTGYLGPWTHDPEDY